MPPGLVVSASALCLLDACTAAGVVAEQGASVEIDRLVVEQTASHGAMATGAASRLALSNADIRDIVTEGRARQYGAGLRVSDGATAALVRGLITGARRSGVEAVGAESLSLEDVLINETASSPYDGRYGRGLSVEGGGEVSVIRSQLVDNRDVGLVAFGDWTRVTLQEVLIDDTGERTCTTLPEGDPNHCSEGYGYGLGVYDGAEVTVDDVDVARSAALGVQVDGGTVSGTGLRVRDCPVCANLQSIPDEYDFEGAIADLELQGCDTAIDHSDDFVPANPLP